MTKLKRIKTNLGVGNAEKNSRGRQLVFVCFLFTLFSNISIVVIRYKVNVIFQAQRHRLSSATIAVHREFMRASSRLLICLAFDFVMMLTMTKFIDWTLIQIEYLGDQQRFNGIA